MSPDAPGPDRRDEPLEAEARPGLDAALAAAFGDRPIEVPPGSVLSRLFPPGSVAPSVALRGEDAGAGPTRPLAVRTDARYEFFGEIARGGVGLVVRGHAVDLGRDVALKVLREEHLEDPQVLRRFVEEAQIGGQLQHPGIVPVYDLGCGPDGRPWFSMKLVKGRTLAAMLAERSDPASERRRFLSSFESVCQTVAYAHSRGVIHRDLKPANMMVGAFGEVLVVDWGLAKVLAQGGVADERRARRADVAPETIVATVRTEETGSQSVVGSVMGTSHYLPPAQAPGDVEHLDERADVFSLGATLCEILTGRPPYPGTDAEALALAARADLSDALARLSRCGADEEPVALARACLSPAPRDRPRDAGALVERLQLYFASLEERAREAQEAAVKD